MGQNKNSNQKANLNSNPGHNLLRYESPEDWAAEWAEYYVQNIKPLLWIDGVGLYYSPVSGLVADAILKTNGDMESVLQHVMRVLREKKAYNEDRGRRYPYASPTGRWYAEMIELFGDRADDKVRLVVSWYVERRAFTKKEQKLITDTSRRHAHSHFKKEQAERLRRWRKAAGLPAERHPERRPLPKPETEEIEPDGHALKVGVYMEWEPVEAEDHPGLYYVIEKVDGQANRLRIGPMERDQVGLLIAERQVYHEQIMMTVLEQMGILDAKIQTKTTSKPIDK